MNLSGPIGQVPRSSAGPKPRVLFVINAAITGGAERHTAALAANLVPLGFETSIFAIKRGTEKPSGAYELIEPSEPEGLFRRAQALAATIDRLSCDLLVAVNQRPLALAALALRLARRKAPSCVIFHTTLLRSRWEEAMQWGYTPLFNRADLVIFISRNQRRHWEGRGLRPKRAATILNGIDTDFYAPRDPEARYAMRRQLGFAETDYVIGCCAMLRAEKNHLQLVDAVAALREQNVPARGLLVGEGPMRGAIEDHARARNIAAHIVISGMQADVRPFVAAFDVGVLCSTAVETLSLSALETLSMGIPMLMSDIGGASEIINGLNGRIYPSGSDADLVQGLQHFTLPTARAAAGIQARQGVQNLFTLSAMNKAYADAFRAVIYDKAPAAR